MVEFFGKMFGGNKNEEVEEEYNRENYEQVAENVKIVLEIGEKNNQLYDDLIGSGLLEGLKGKHGKEIYRSFSKYYSDFLGNVRDLIRKTMDEFNKLDEKGEKEAYSLNKEYDDLLLKLEQKRDIEFKKNSFFGDITVDGIKKDAIIFPERIEKGIEVEKNNVEKFEKEKLGMKEKKEE